MTILGSFLLWFTSFVRYCEHKRVNVPNGPDAWAEVKCLYHNLAGETDPPEETSHILMPCHCHSV